IDVFNLDIGSPHGIADALGPLFNFTADDHILNHAGFLADHRLFVHFARFDGALAECLCASRPISWAAFHGHVLFAQRNLFFDRLLGHTAVDAHAAALFNALPDAQLLLNHGNRLFRGFGSCLRLCRLGLPTSLLPFKNAAVKINRVVPLHDVKGIVELLIVSNIDCHNRAAAPAGLFALGAPLHAEEIAQFSPEAAALALRYCCACFACLLFTQANVAGIKPSVDKFLPDAFRCASVVKQTDQCARHNKLLYACCLLVWDSSVTVRRDDGSRAGCGLVSMRSTCASSLRNVNRWGMRTASRRRVMCNSSRSSSRFSTTRTSSINGTMMVSPSTRTSTGPSMKRLTGLRSTSTSSRTSGSFTNSSRSRTDVCTTTLPVSTLCVPMRRSSLTNGTVVDDGRSAGIDEDAACAS